MDSRRSIKRLLKGGKTPTYHQRVSHVRNKSSYGGSGAAGGLLLGSGAAGVMAGEGGEAATGGVHGEDFSRETLLRIVQKEVIEAPMEQEILFLCAINKGKHAKGGYNLGGFVGGGAGGERSRFLCVTLEQGSRPPFATGAGVSAAAGEVFVVMYYFTVLPGPTDYQVTIKSDVYLNDLTAVEFGGGADFTLVFDQASGPLQLAAPSQALRDEIVWNLLTVCDLFCGVQPETRAVDLHGLSLTASTQGFLPRNEALAKYMAIYMALQQDKGGIGGGQRAGGAGGPPSSSVLMNPYLSAHASNDEELEAMLGRFEWPARTVDDIDGQLSQQLRQLERETVEVLLSWETRATQQEEEGKKDKAKAAAGPAPSSSSNKGGGKGLSLWGAMKKAAAPAVAPSKPATAIDPTSRGYLSTLQLVRMLDDLEGELEAMEAWLGGKGEALKFIQADMQEIEAENNRLERQWTNYSRLNALLKPLVLDLSLDPTAERMLRNPGGHLQECFQQGLIGDEGSESETSGLVAERVSSLVTAAKRVQRALALLEGREEAVGGLEAMAMAALSLHDDTGKPGGTVPLLPPPILIGSPAAGVVGGAAAIPPSPAPGPSQQQQQQQQPPSLKAIPRRLMGMEALRAQTARLAAVRAEFVERASKHVGALFAKFVRPEALPGASKDGGGASGGGGSRASVLISSSTTLLLTSTPQALGQYQRMFHTRVLDYEPLLAVVVEMLQDLPSAATAASLLDGLLHAYSHAGSSTLYRPLLKTYFSQLLQQQQLQTRPSSSNLLDAAAPTSMGKADLASLPRAHIRDMGHSVVLHPSASFFPGNQSPTTATMGGLASYYQQQAAALGNTASLAIGQALTQLVPLVRREQAFVTELFKLRPEEVADDRGKLQSVLGVEFDKLREKLTEMATTATDSDPLEALAILTVMQQSLTTLTLSIASGGAGAGAAATSSPPASPPSSSHRRSASSPSSPSRHRISAAFFNAGRVAGAAGTGGWDSSSSSSSSSFLAAMLDQLQHTLEQRLAKFVQEQEQWVLHQQPDVKRAGVLAPFAKFPVFVDRLALAVRGRPSGLADAALTRLAASLLGWLEKVAQRDAKYADVVRLENCHFFVQTLSPRQQRLQGSTALLPFIDQAQAAHESAVQRYVAWSLSYQFPALTAFFAKLEELIGKVGAPDVAIHVPKAQLQKLMATEGPCSRKALADGLQSAYKRLRKHISDDSGLFLPLWDRLASLLHQRFVRYEEVVLRCYDVRLEPSANLVRQLAQECRAQGGK